MPSTRVIGGAAVALVAVIAVVALATRGARASACTEGFTRFGARCCPGVVARDAPAPDAPCPPPADGACPAPLVARDGVCHAPDATVLIARAEIEVGPSDWEAEGRVAPRKLAAGPLRLDALEATVGQVACPTCPLPGLAPVAGSDPARAAFGLTRDEARRYCAARGGRLPSEDEWLVAAASAQGVFRRYPWGNAGAVCRRVSFGMSRGPCAWGAVGPDTVGARPDGRTPDGVYDMAGNVAEWVDADEGGKGVVRGGAWSTELAADLRTWARRVVDVGARDPSIGVRCAYDAGVR